jgi:glycosyltransferase involved in cell wall biosynthesis
MTLVRAAASSGVPVHLAGDGPQGEALMAEVRRLSAPVTFHGHLEVPRLREVIAASRVTVLPAEWYENCPMSVLESYAMGKPVIGAAIGGLPELIEQNVTGMTFPTGSAEQLAECLTGFRDMPDARVMAMGQACRDYVASRHRPDGYQARICEVYREAGWQA